MDLLNLPISAFIIAKNEELLISKAILSIKKLTLDITVIDSGSTDKTVELAKALGANVVFNEWPGYVKQKIFGENLCTNKWVLNLDADEELSDDLIEEIRSLFKNNIDEYNAYSMDFLILHRNIETPKKYAPSNSYIRLYNKNYVGFAYKDTKYSTHDLVQFKENSVQKIYHLKGVAYHRSVSSLKQLVDKSNFYSSEQAQDLVNNNRCPTKLRIFFEIFRSFFKAYFVRRYIVFGFDGFVDSVVFAMARFLRLAKAREIYIKNKKTNNA